jgi:hypothetical protein
VGATVAGLVVQALPWALRLSRGEELNLTFTKVLGTALVFIIIAICGACAAYVIGGATKPKHAVAYGLSWQSILGGFLQLRAGEHRSARQDVGP